MSDEILIHPELAPLTFALGFLKAPFATVKAALFDSAGNIKQVTMYDAYGDRIRQFDLGDTARHGEGYHTFEYDAKSPRFAPGGGRRSDHFSFDDFDGVDMDTTWIRVNDQAAAERLLTLTHGFHDAVTTAAEWKGVEFVNQARELELHSLGTLTLHIQFQTKGVDALEVRFERVKSFCYDYDFDIECEVIVGSEVCARMLTWEVTAAGMQYRTATS